MFLLYVEKGIIILGVFSSVCLSLYDNMRNYVWSAWVCRKPVSMTTASIKLGTDTLKNMGDHFLAIKLASRTYLRKCMTLKLVNQINLIVKIKTFTKPNCNLCMEECLTILKIYVTNTSQLWTIIRRYTGPAGKKCLSINFS